MERHLLQGRSEDELLWFERRDFIRALATWTALGGFAGAQAQQRSNVVERAGEATVNGRPLAPGESIQTGDTVETGPDGRLVFVVGSTSFLMRQNTRMEIERGNSLNAVSVLRLLTGAVGSVWNKGEARRIVTPTLTLGIRGTGVYTEVRPQENLRSYFCNCYGTVDMTAGTESLRSQSAYHQSFWGEPEPRDGRWLTPAAAINHTDEEMEMLAHLAGERTAWEIAGRRGVKDGRGYMEQQPPEMHPANKAPQK